MWATRPDARVCRVAQRVVGRGVPAPAPAPQAWLSCRSLKGARLPRDPFLLGRPPTWTGTDAPQAGAGEPSRLNAPRPWSEAGRGGRVCYPAQPSPAGAEGKARVPPLRPAALFVSPTPVFLLGREGDG